MLPQSDQRCRYGSKSGIPLYSPAALKQGKKAHAGLFMLQWKRREFWQSTNIDFNSPLDMHVIIFSNSSAATFYTRPGNASPLATQYSLSDKARLLVETVGIPCEQNPLT